MYSASLKPCNCCQTLSFQAAVTLYRCDFVRCCPSREISNYLYRIGFQQRGSPQAHAILWVEGAPQPDADSRQICQFVDHYVASEIPENNEPLRALVTELQRYTHSASCRKKGSLCRFNFSRAPTEQTILAKPETTENTEPEQLVILRKQATDT